MKERTLPLLVLVITAAALMVGGCAAPAKFVPATVALNSSRVEVPIIRAESNVPLVMVSGAGPGAAKAVAGGARPTEVAMLLDTGAPYTIVSNELAQRQGAKARDLQVSMVDAGGTIDRLPVARYEEFCLGGACFRDVDAALNNITSLNRTLPPGSRRIEGGLGLLLFQDVLLTIDYERKALVIERGELPWPDGKDVLPMYLGAGGRMIVPVHLGDREMWCLMDTGFSGGLSVPEWCKTSFPGSDRTIPGPSFVFYSGSGKSGTARLLDDLRIGHHRIRRPIASVGLGSDPTIGSAYLSNFVITIDQRNRRVRFARRSTAPIEVPSLRHPGFYVDPKTGIVLTVIPGSGADRAGLKVGDRIIKLEGIPFEKLFSENTDQRLARADRVGLILKREGAGMLSMEVPYTTLLP